MAVDAISTDILNDNKLIEEINNAFIKKFKTEDNYYIYDANTNRILRTEKMLWELFSDIDIDNRSDVKKLERKYGRGKIIDALLKIRNAKKEGLYSTHIPKIGMTKNREEVKEYLKAGMNTQVILNVTEKCNLRCKYCTYSGIYKEMRTHSEKDMTWETAKLSLDEFIINSRNYERPALTFYGGEPMMNMELIKRCVEYMKKTEKIHHFQMTINGTLLDKENIEYFIENDFNLVISHNGPRKIHDEYRVYPDGSGTWETIMQNLELMKAIDSKYYKNRFLIRICAG